ncbi:phosphomannomutase/phosphoglucomutase [Desulfohalovibrio reitneri]|uniref:phosphomannomutase/phosphoglucomutase n=1 Tax=Desulfohalovibrio reitneri TaxID=1307759 RepID=UPI0004A72E6D|nr:phosphomannomutase/phosphoglucomutase [Desulfohalovibrio reitneri]
MRPINPAIFRKYDIRGIVDQDFDPEWVERLGLACGRFFREDGRTRAAVARDARHTSPAYAEAAALGLAMAGLDVVLLDRLPTPAFYFATRHLDLWAGVMITASHNPPEYNGFKILRGERCVYGDDIQAIRALMEEEPAPAERAGIVSRHDILPAYLDALAERSSLARPVKVVVDGGNGAAGDVAAEALRRAGAEVIELYCAPDPDLPNHHPDPSVAENTRDLAEAVRKSGADLGLGLDGDGDRVGLVDETGGLWPNDRVAALLARECLSRHPGATVLGDVKCSHLFFRDVENHGGNPVMAATGHSLMKAKMAELGAAFGGELSGHMFFGADFFGYDDAALACLKLAEIASRADGPVSSLPRGWPETHATPEMRIETPEGTNFDVVRRAVDHFSGRYPTSTIDGVRVDFGDGWALVRASNTQSVVVVRCEAETAERLAEIRAEVEDRVRGWIDAPV